MENDLKEVQQRLQARRAALLQIIEAGAEGRRPVTLDQQRVGRLSRMDEMQVQAMAEETGRRREAELARIDAALHRIENGDYGFCTACDESIAPKRLEHDPAVPLCINCAGRAG